MLTAKVHSNMSWKGEIFSASLGDHVRDFNIEMTGYHTLNFVNRDVNNFGFKNWLQ